MIKAFEYVREKIENDIKKEKEKLRKKIEGTDFDTKSEDEQTVITAEISDMQAALNSELDTGKVGSRMYMLSHNCIYGTDANSRMARTSKMNMIMHGDGHGGVHHHNGLLNVNGIFEERFDVILTNPPFGQNVDRSQRITEADQFTDENMKKKYRRIYGEAYDEALKQVDDNIGTPLISLYDMGKVSTLTEVLFMERCLRLLKKGGRMIPMLRMPNIVNGDIDCTEFKYLPYKAVGTDKEPDKWLLRKGDFLINRTNSKELVGKSAVFKLDGDYTYASYVIRYRFNTSLVLPDYVNILFMLPIVRIQIDTMSRQTAGQCNINSDEIGSIRIPVPSIPIQQAIIDKYNSAKDGSRAYYEKADELRRKAAVDFEHKIFYM